MEEEPTTRNCTRGSERGVWTSVYEEGFSVEGNTMTWTLTFDGPLADHAPEHAAGAVLSDIAIEVLPDFRLGLVHAQPARCAGSACVSTGQQLLQGGSYTVTDPRPEG